MTGTYVRTIVRKLVVLLAAVLLGSTAFAQTRWDMHIAWPEGNYHTQGANRFADLVRERTGGEVDITVHAGGALGFRGPEVLRLVRGGTVPLAENFMENVLGDEPIFGLFALPLTTEYDEAWRLYEIARPTFEEVLERNNQILLYTSPWAPQGLYTQQQVESPDDFSSLTVRTAGENLTQFVEALGARALTIPFGELYSALATGVINSVVTSPTSGVDASLWEVTDFFYPALVPNIPLNLATMNRDAFARLSPEAQQAVLESARETETYLWEIAQERQGEARARLEAEGMTVITDVPEAVAAHLETPVEGQVQAWLERVGEPGEAILREFRGE
jgi:TRAP-type C4-dicarboxylate transport system substrate-binding protein